MSAREKRARLLGLVQAYRNARTEFDIALTRYVNTPVRAPDAAEKGDAFERAREARDTAARDVADCLAEDVTFLARGRSS